MQAHGGAKFTDIGLKAMMLASQISSEMSQLPPTLRFLQWASVESAVCSTLLTIDGMSGKKMLERTWYVPCKTSGLRNAA